MHHDQIKTKTTECKTIFSNQKFLVFFLDLGCNLTHCHCHDFPDMINYRSLMQTDSSVLSSFCQEFFIEVKKAMNSGS